MRKSQEIENELKKSDFAESNGPFAFGTAVPSGLSLGFKDAGIASYMADGGVGYAITLIKDEMVIVAVDIYADEKKGKGIEKMNEILEGMHKKISKEMIEEITFKGTLFSPNLTIKLKDEKKKIICAVEKKYRDAMHSIVNIMAK